MLVFIHRWIVIAFGLIPASEGVARWNHRDADSVDRMSHLGTEYANDILSYRDPLAWDDIWRRTTVGLRTSAGSMNMKELYHARDILLRTSAEDAWQLAYSSELQELPAQRVEDSFLELSYGPEEQSWRLGLRGDGNTEKSFADIGASASWTPAEDSWLRLVYWAVDPFYSEKKLEPGDFRTRNPATGELNARSQWKELAVEITHAQDQPVKWHRSLRNEIYTYRRQNSELHVEFARLSDQRLYATLRQEQRREGLAALSLDTSQGFVHKEHVGELGLKEGLGREVTLWAIWGMKGRTGIIQKVLENAQAKTLDHKVHRDETAFLWRRSSPWGEGAHQQEWGLVINHVDLRERDGTRRTEMKLIWGPDFQIGQKGRLRLNSTWDLDQLAADFPFRKHFHPWGGGQASFLVHF